MARAKKISLIPKSQKRQSRPSLPKKDEKKELIVPKPKLIGIKPRGFQLPGFKPTQKIPAQVMAGAIGVLLIVLFIYGGVISYQYYLKYQIRKISKETVSLSSRRESELEKEILLFSKQLDLAKILLTSHSYSSKIIQLVEELTLPRIRFFGFSGDIEERRVDMEGQADSYKTLAQQLLVLEKKEGISEVEVSGIGLSTEGGVRFQLKFKFDPKVLIKEL